jgi:putative membrane protein
MYLLLHLAVLTAVVVLLARTVPGVRVRSTGAAIAVAVVFSVLNFFLGWLIRAVLFVPALLTFGLLFLFMTLIVNAVVLWLTDKLIDSFEITRPGALWVCAFFIGLANWLFGLLTRSASYGGLPHAHSFRL